MKTPNLMLECGRCGETRLMTLSDEEAKGIKDGVEPAYRRCDACQKTTGWIEAASRPDNKKQNADAKKSKGGSSDLGRQGRVTPGQERMATNSERNEVNDLTIPPKAVHYNE